MSKCAKAQFYHLMLVIDSILVSIAAAIWCSMLIALDYRHRLTAFIESLNRLVDSWPLVMSLLGTGYLSPMI